MSEEALLTEDQSHYEISLTAGQAFVAFVLLLLSLAASFAFGLLIGKGQNELKLKDASVINEAQVAPAKKKVVEVPAEEFKQPEVTETQAASMPITETTAPAPVPATAQPSTVNRQPSTVPATTGPAYAQLLSSSDQKAAEALAEKLIGAGFNTAYVERKDKVFRVRVKFGSEAEARGAEANLKTFSKDVWITKAE